MVEEEAGAGSTSLELVGRTMAEEGGKTPVGRCATVLVASSVSVLEVVGRMTSDGAGELPVGAAEGSCVVGVLLVASISVADGVSDGVSVVAAADEDDVVGVRISEIAGRIPVGAEEDRSVAWVVLGSSASVSEGV